MATAWIAACDSPQPPGLCGTIPQQTLFVGESATEDVSGNFSEPDGQTLSYAAEVSDTAVADVSVAGSVVTIVATAKGEVTVTVTATDPGGLAAMQSFRVMVPNRPPVPIDTIPSQTIEAETTAALDLLPYFNDPDGDSLAFSAAVSDSRGGGGDDSCSDRLPRGERHLEPDGLLQRPRWRHACVRRLDLGRQPGHGTGFGPPYVPVLPTATVYRVAYPRRTSRAARGCWT